MKRAVVDLSDVCGDYDVYTSKMVEERVEVRQGDILIIHTGYHHFGWDMPTADEIRYMVKHPAQIGSSLIGPRPKNCAGSESTAEVLTTHEYHHPRLDAAPGSSGR